MNGRFERNLWFELLTGSLFLQREGHIAWLLADRGVCICLFQPWFRCLAIQGKQAPSSPSVLPASEISVRRAGKLHHWGTTEKKLWSTSQLTHWDPEAPRCQILSPCIQPTWCSEPCCHSITAFSESWMAVGCEAKDLVILAAAI